MRTRRGVKHGSRVVSGIGARLRHARLAVGLTQQRLAGDRYTKAYVSALENGLVNPSMAALDYLAGRLGTTASQLIADDEAGWARVEAELRLAAGDWPAAADAFAGLLITAVDPIARAELLRGQAEALARLERGVEAAPLASEAIDLFEASDRGRDALQARYWLAMAHYAQDNVDEARAMLQSLLAEVRDSVPMPADFRLRLLSALANLESNEGNHEQALGFLAQIREVAAGLGARHRAAELFERAFQQRQQGDPGAAIRAGYASLGLFAEARAELEMAALERALAHSLLATGDTAAAAELAQRARAQAERLADDQLLARVLETEARIEAEHLNWEGALDLASQSLAVAGRVGDENAAVAALLTTARVNSSTGRTELARDAFERAAEIARSVGRPQLVRRALTEWADHLASSGDHRAAFQLTREALGDLGSLT